MPADRRIAVGRIPSPAAERKFQTWLFEHTERPVFLMHWRPLDDLPGWRLVPEGPVLRLVKPGGKPPAPREGGDAFADLAFSSEHRDEAAARITGDLLVARGTSRALAKDLDGARATFVEAEHAYLAYPDGLAHLAAACLEAGFLAEARGHADAALVLAPRSRAALRTLATVLTRQKKWAEAKAAIDRLIALDPKDTAARLILVQFHRDQGNRRLAIFELEKLSKEQPREARWLVMAGDLSLEERDSLSAFTYYQRALAIAPERADLLDKVQAILTGEGRTGLGDPFAPGRPGGAFDIPGAPRDPLEGLFPPGVPGDPRDPFRRR
ncbi:MAG: hypothetical protein HUU15_12450 [Candidatus Brocadiae bacterium]|nr:hypothetical protein [Candidatus Brocadiia bacterium]